MKIRNASVSIMIVAACVGVSEQNAQAAMFTQQVFATGAAVGATAPDSITVGNGSIWVAYGNNADSTGAGGSSLVVRYSPGGAVINTWSIPGSVDGLRIDPAGNVWALQNQDANAAVTVINPNTNLTTSFNYGSSYTANGNSSSRGFDDAVFFGGHTFLSETNPNAGSDPVILQLTSGLASPLQVSGLLQSTITGTNLATGKTGSVTITDPDSLKLMPGGGLALTGEGDRTIVFVQNIGTATQSVSFVPLVDAKGQTISGKPDDTVFPNATQGVFYIADTGANTIYALTANGLAPNSIFVSAGTVFGSLDTTTGMITPAFTGMSPHGADFVTFAAAGIPEPGSLVMVLGGLLLIGAGSVYRRHRH